MQVRLLGPVDVVVDGEARPVRGLRRKAVLAVLALHAGEAVSTGLLADAVWGQDAPATAVNTLQSHISYLRTVLGDRGSILARPPGYLLEPGGGTDVAEAERLMRRGAEAAEPAEAVRHLCRALELWRGRPLADVTGVAWLEEQAERLDLLWLRLRRAMSEARLAAGDHVLLVPELEQMAADHPLDERICEQLMLALYRSGRQADALAVYRRLRQTLDTELGIDPGQAVRQLETAILRQDPALDAATPHTPAAPPAEATAAPVPVPAQLPPAVPVFTGRDAELASLDALAGVDRASLSHGAAAAHGPGAGPAAAAGPAICAVSGTAGVGKTALAVHWAHRVAGSFPDGQLYVNLRGFDPAGTALDPGQVLHGFLEAFGVPATRIPADLDAQAGLYRSLLAGKRVLVVLDNARSAGQVRPLLPGSPGCLAIVTSRDALGGLVAAEGARPLPVGLLGTADARELLTRRLGAARVAAEPGAVDDIIASCARLPLALTVAASRAATSPAFPLAAVAAELREAGHALDPFHGDDHATDVRAVFSWSYRALSPAAARLFRLLGLHPGPDLSVAAAASLAGMPSGQVRAVLAELTRAHLLAEPAPGRYALHDLLRAYASELAHARETERDRHAAIHRVLDHYLHTAHHAAEAMEPFLHAITVPPPQPGTAALALATSEAALAWFTGEHATLLAAVRLAARAGLSDHAWRTAWMLSTYLLRRGYWEDQATACRAALEAARAAGDLTGQAHMLHRLAAGCAKLGRAEDSRPLFAEALRLFEATGDHASQAVIHGTLGWMAQRDERPADSLGHSLRSLELYQRAGHRTGQANALKDVGFAHAMLGNHEQAIGYCESALAAMREMGERRWEGAIWDSLGYIHHQRGDYERAVTCYDRAIAASRELADRFNEADTLSSLGDVHRSAGDMRAAERSWRAALRIFDEIGHPDRDNVRAKLRHAGEVALAAR
jgi:DNA-binding SARP family transcriptional activator/tetratricopeptide (TPR) repeat protein